LISDKLILLLLWGRGGIGGGGRRRRYARLRVEIIFWGLPGFLVRVRGIDSWPVFSPSSSPFNPSTGGREVPGFLSDVALMWPTWII
jgi:hypothetical protein